MVNYKRVVCDVALLAVMVTLTAAAPAADCTERHYDQRQNGTENYRLNIDGVVIAVAPAETLFAAASEIDFSDLLELSDFGDLQEKPKPPHEHKPQQIKPPEPSPKPDEPSLASTELPSKLDSRSEKKDSSKRKREKAQRWEFVYISWSSLFNGTKVLQGSIPDRIQIQLAWL